MFPATLTWAGSAKHASAVQQPRSPWRERSLVKERYVLWMGPSHVIILFFCKLLWERLLLSQLTIFGKASNHQLVVVCCDEVLVWTFWTPQLVYHSLSRFEREKGKKMDQGHRQANPKNRIGSRPWINPFDCRRCTSLLLCRRSGFTFLSRQKRRGRRFDPWTSGSIGNDMNFYTRSISGWVLW